MTTFGVEIEISTRTITGEYLTTNQIAEAIRQHGVRCQSENYNHATRAYWKVITDASSGYEIVSPILDARDGDAAWNQIIAVCAALRSLGAKVTRDCGLHVHLYMGGETTKQIGNFVANYIKIEHAIDGALPNSRRRSNNQYCRSLIPFYKSGRPARVHNLYGAAAEFSDADWTTPAVYIAAVNNTLDAIKNARDNADLAGVANPGFDRYTKINLQRLTTWGTVEVRHHSGTINAQKIIMWTRFLLSLYRRSKSQVYVKKMTTMDLAHPSDWARRWGLDDYAAAQWLGMRWLGFNRQTQDSEDRAA